MFNFITNLPKETLSVISDFAKVIIPSLIAYLAAKHNRISTARRIEIKQKQFDLVYLPIYLITIQFEKNITYKTMSDCYKRVQKIIYKNYQYVNPKTIRLLDNLNEELSNENINYLRVSRFIYQNKRDYEMLKKNLGYPSDSIVAFIKSLNRIDKILYFLQILVSIMFFYAAISMFINLFNLILGDAFWFLIQALASLFFWYIIHFIKK